MFFMIKYWACGILKQGQYLKVHANYNKELAQTFSAHSALISPSILEESKDVIWHFMRETNALHLSENPTCALK